MNTKEKIAVMQAFVDGQSVQQRARRPVGAQQNEWILFMLREPHWDWYTMEYRVAPKKIERWVNIFNDGCVGYDSIHETRADADNYASGKIGRIACLHLTGIEGEGL